MYEVEEEELWSEIEGFPEYAISSFGNIKHVDRPTLFRKTAINHQGFPTLTLFKQGMVGRYVRQVNKLVAIAFLDPPEYRDQTAIWHIDGDLLNCRADNLRWDRRDRVLEWNEMHRTQVPRYNTAKVQCNATGEIFANAFECGLAVSEIESAIIHHIGRFPEQYADQARFRHV